MIVTNQMLVVNAIAFLVKDMDSDELLAMNLFIEYMLKELAEGRIRDEADMQTAQLGFVDYILNLED